MEPFTASLFNIISDVNTETPDVTINYSDVTIAEFPTTTQSDDVNNANDDDPLLTALDILLNYVYPVLIGVGVVANVLTLLIVTRPRSRKLSLSLYLGVLAVSDILVLVLDFVNNYFRDVFKINTIGYNTGVCVVYRWVFDSSFTFSAWLIVLLTFERFMAIWFPFRAKTLFSNKGNKALIAATLALSALWNIRNLWAWQSINESCDFAEGWEDFQRLYNMWLTFGAYSHVPTVILLTMNALIIHRLRRMRDKRQAMSETKDAHSNKKQDTETRKISVTILTVSFTYLILTVPASVFYIYQYYNATHINMALKMALVEVCFLLLVLSNHAVNFFLYVMTSQSFRQELVRLFRPSSPYAMETSKASKGGAGLHVTGSSGNGANSTGSVTMTTAVSGVYVSQVTLNTSASQLAAE